MCVSERKDEGYFFPEEDVYSQEREREKKRERERKKEREGEREGERERGSIAAVLRNKFSFQKEKTSIAPLTFSIAPATFRWHL